MKALKKYLLFLLSVSAAIGGLSQGSTEYKNRRLILRDEGLSQLSLVDFAAPANNWFVPVPAGRDLQLIGNERVLIGTGVGYEEYDITTGKKVGELTTFTGTIAARRLRNGNTLMTGLNWEGKKGIVLAEVDTKGKIAHLTNFPEFPYVRLVRETQAGTFLVTADTIIFEGDATGKILWRAKLSSKKSLHMWQSLRLANGQTLTSAGFGAKFQIFAADGTPLTAITGPEEVHPYFFAGFQILSNGNRVVTNWQGHGRDHGASGAQLLEFSSGGKLVWSWKQDPAKFSSLQGVIVLDGLNTEFLHVEDENGVLVPVSALGK